MKAIAQALMQAGRSDLATVLAADHWSKYIGETVWGKEGAVHFYRGSLRFEQYPPGGKTKGVRTSKVVLYDMDRRGELPPAADNALNEFAAGLKTKTWKQLVGLLIAAHNRSDGAVKIQISQQKAIDAPNPAHQKLPKEFTNKRNVFIRVSTTGDRSVALRDLNDRANEPSAFTQGPKAFQLAIKTFADWKDLDYRGILTFWSTNKIKHHSYMGMD